MTRLSIFLRAHQATISALSPAGWLFGVPSLAPLIAYRVRAVHWPLPLPA